MRCSLRPTSPSPRPGFTLVELLVSMGLTLFIMVILVEAFTAGLSTFQGLRALGGLQNQTRSGIQLLRNDLQQNHFEGGRRLSDATFWNQPRQEGFFYIRQGTAAGTNNVFYRDEGSDLDNANNSYLARDHILHFSNRLTGNRRENFVFDNTASAGFISLRTSLTRLTNDANYGLGLLAASASTQYGSQWSETAYLLTQQTAPQPSTIPTNPNVALHNLYRINLLVVPYTDVANGIVGNGTSPPATIPYDATKFVLTSQKNNGGSFFFFSPNDLAKGSRSFNPAAINAATAPDPTLLRGKSLVCSNVVSFQVRIMKAGGTTFEDIPGLVFDSANPNPGYSIVGIQVILRVYDPASGLTRQQTLVQDL